MPSKLHLVLSALIHAVAVLFLIGPTIFWSALFPETRPSDSTPTAAAPAMKSELVIVDPAPEPPARPKDSPTPVVGTTSQQAEPLRRDYAGEPQVTQRQEANTGVEDKTDTEAEAVVSQKQPGKAPATARTSAVDSAPVKKLPPSDESRSRGERVPAVHFVGLSLDDMERIVRSGQGVVMTKCGEQRYVATGSLASPAQVRPASSHDLLAYSERALPVSPANCAAVRKQLKSDFAIPDEQLKQCRFHLVLTNRLDHLIYAHQKDAANSVEKELEDIVVTVGRLEFRGDAVHGFRVSSLLLQDGKRIILGDDLP